VPTPNFGYGPSRGERLTGTPTPFPAPPEPQEEPRKRSKLVDAVIEIATTVGLAVVLYLIITTFVVQTFRVEQQSMTDTLQPGEHLLIDKLTPRFDEYSRGDVVVFHPNGDTDKTPFIKRVIGVGGETLEVRDGSVWIDGVKLEEDYTRLSESTEPSRLGGQDTWEIPEGGLFVMGDNRTGSKDSRSRDLGVIETDHVVGRAWLRFFPINTLGLLPTPEYAELDSAE
jgi:signal peptidase I